MRVPAALPLKQIRESDRSQILAFFRNLVAKRFIRQSIGQEASEERLETMYDEGWIKIAVEPGPDGLYYWRVLLYDQMRSAYSVVDHIKFEFSEQTKSNPKP